MLEIELCRICLADSIRMYPIEHTRYHDVFDWYTEDTVSLTQSTQPPSDRFRPLQTVGR